MIAGFVGREIMYVGVTGVRVNHSSAEYQRIFQLGEIYDIHMSVGEELNFANLLIVEPGRARFSQLHFEKEFHGGVNQNAITITNGVMSAAELTPVGHIIVRVMYQTTTHFSLWVEIH